MTNQSPEEQAVTVEWNKSPVICMSYRSDFSIHHIRSKLGIESCRETPNFNGKIEWPLLCLCSDPHSGSDTGTIKIYRCEWPSELVSLNQSCYIDGDKCRACYGLTQGQDMVLVTFDPGVVFILEDMKILAVSEDRINLPEVRELKSQYQKVETFNFNQIEKFLSHYSDLYLATQLRYLMNRITEGGLLLKPEIARQIRKGPLVLGGRFMFEKMTFYTCLPPSGVQKLLESMEDIEGVLTVPSELYPPSSGSGTEGTFSWTLYGLGHYSFNRRDSSRTNFSSIYHHGRVIQQWINSKIRPLAELFISIGSKK